MAVYFGDVFRAYTRGDGKLIIRKKGNIVRSDKLKARIAEFKKAAAACAESTPKTPEGKLDIKKYRACIAGKLG